MSEFDQVFFKVAPRDFAAFLFDTNDLSMTRGGSLTLLAMPQLLFAHLEAIFSDLRFDLIQGAASELFFSVEGAAGIQMGTLGIEPVRPAKPAGVKKHAFENAMAKAMEIIEKNGLSRESVEAAAAQLDRDLKGKGGGPERMAGMIVQKLDSNGNETSAAAPISDNDEEKIMAEVRKFLRSGQGNAGEEWPFDLFRFGVAKYRPARADAASGTPARVIGALETALGRERMRSLSCPVPAPPANSGKPFKEVVCSYNRQLGADLRQAKGRPTSGSAFRRWQVGRDVKRKQGVYERVLDHGSKLALDFDGGGLARTAVALVGDATGVIDAGKAALDGLNEFVNDFQQLVTAPPEGLTLSAQSGLCLLRMDGNKFGNLRASQGNLVRYRQLAEYLDILKARLMAKIIDWLASRRDMAVTVNADGDEGPRTRFETLLWGGDEFAFVCPAWAGWELAQVIAAETRSWVALDGKQLHFATGIGFSHHKTPIAQFLDAVEDLEGLAKADRCKSLVLALSWEGVDRVHLPPVDYMARLYSADDVHETLVFSASDLPKWTEWRRALSRAVGRSALHRWVGFGQSMNGVDAWEQIGKEMKRIGTGEGAKILGEIESGGNPFLQLKQLVFLHDYLEPDIAVSASGRDAA